MPTLPAAHPVPHGSPTLRGQLRLVGVLAMVVSLVASARLGAVAPTPPDTTIGNGAATVPSETGTVPPPAGISLQTDGRSDRSTLPPVDAAAPPPDILIINSYAPGYEWSDDELAGLLSVLTPRYSAIEPVIQYLDSKRFPDPARERWLLEDLADKCRTRPPRLIITLDNAAFDFALKYRADLGADVPLVFGGLNRFTPEMIAGQRAITGVSEETDFRGTFQLIQSLKPDTKRILVIGNRSESSIEKRKAFESQRPEGSERYQIEYYEDWTSDQLIQRLSTLPDGTVGLILDVTVDAAGHYNYNDSSFTAALASLARVPVFITARPPGKNDWTTLAWDGIGGGLVVASRHGEIVGELAARVLAGEPADAIPVVRYTPQSLEVDYRHMQHFGLSPDLLPPGTVILNAPTTFYQINRARVIAAGAIFGLLCVIIAILSVNIFQRRRAERALRRAEEQLRSSQKMEAIGLLAGGVAHDFNNILQVIRGHAGFLQESLVVSAQDREDIEAIQAAAQRAAQLTRQLLAFSRKQALNMEPLEANALVADLAKMLRRVLGEHIDLQMLLLPEPVTLLADKGQLEQVLLNLCLNARDAMPGGGRIVLSLERTVLAASDCAKNTDLKPGPHLVIKVSDTGCGMPRAVLDRLFEPFFTTKPPGKGTGLGLSVVYGIIHQHGGAISVYSEVGSGTVFRILLPLVSTELQPTAGPAKAGFPVGHGTLLLAEDDPAVRALAVRELGRNGFHVLTACDGEEAEAVLARHHREIRLAVLDVLMPKRSGRQVHDYLKAHHPGIRVLFCSGYTAEMLPPGTAPDPGYALLNKPYSSHDLLTAVHRLLKE